MVEPSGTLSVLVTWRVAWRLMLTVSQSTLLFGAAGVGQEYAARGGQGAMNMYCGGRTPNDDAIDVYRSVLSMGQSTGIDDGVDRDDHEHSTTEFPFLAAP